MENEGQNLNNEVTNNLNVSVDNSPLKDEDIVEITPLDITSPHNQTRVIATIEKPQNLMELIQGPRFPDMKNGEYMSYPHLTNQNNLALFNATTNTNVNYNNPVFPFAGIDFTSSMARCVKRKRYPLVDTLVAFVVQNSPERGLNLSGRALPGAISKYSSIFQGWQYDSGKKNPPYLPLAKLLVAPAYTAPTTNIPQLSILKISTFNNNINSRISSFGTNVSFPSDVVMLDLSSITQGDLVSIGKLGLFGRKIVDISDHIEQANVAFTNRTVLDPVLMQVCEDTLLKSDKEWCLFDVLPYIPGATNTTINQTRLTEELPTYDPVEALFSWICKTNYDSFDSSLTQLGNGANAFAGMNYRQLFQTIRICKTWMHQQAAKMLNYWGSIDGSDNNDTAAFPLTLYNISKSSIPRPFGDDVNIACFRYAWIPNEISASQSSGVELDDADDTYSTASGYTVYAKEVIYPRGIVYVNGTTNVNLTYYNRTGRNVAWRCFGTNSALLQTAPIDIEVETVRAGINNNYRISNAYMGDYVIDYKKPSTYDDSFLNIKIKKAWRK